MKTHVALLALVSLAAVCEAKKSCEDLLAKMDKKDCDGAGKETTKCKKLAFQVCKRNCNEVEGNLGAGISYG